ncbi:hypothetical protein EWJ82_23905 [Salmonella enterica subsp. enterica serovar Weybridge]|nr:hypothetical protein [Salmonella enterica subsp. enterica serovar Weybridge]
MRWGDTPPDAVAVNRKTGTGHQTPTQGDALKPQRKRTTKERVRTGEEDVLAWKSACASVFHGDSIWRGQAEKITQE